QQLALFCAARSSPHITFFALCSSRADTINRRSPSKHSSHCQLLYQHSTPFAATTSFSSLPVPQNCQDGTHKLKVDIWQEFRV
ncbi:hypothetical protein SISSUDRAFT_1133638, partial [Sistotremastrum suecicum HHB10207 ss-3]